MAQNICAAQKFRGFTLAELLTAVLVISVIMVALAPVITKRMKESISVQTDNKKGLEIYTNPGTYTFDVPIGINTLFIQGSGGGGAGAGSTYVEKEKSFTSSATWTVPTGVNEITLAITGAGGGGGGANGAATPEVNTHNPAVYNNKCLSDEFLAIRGAENEEDLCWTKYNATFGAYTPGVSDRTLNAKENCTTTSCCWKTSVGSHCSNYTATGGAPKGCERPVCNYFGAQKTCKYLHSYINPDNESYTYNLPTEAELNKISNNLVPWSIDAGNSGLGLASCYYQDSSTPKKIPKASWSDDCPRGGDKSCSPFILWQYSSGGTFPYWEFTNSKYTHLIHYPNNLSNIEAFSVRCVRSLNRYTRYSASGGSSGAVLEKTINVLPNDTFEITIGQGGAGGASKSKGSQGGTTKIVHKR